MGTMTLGIVLGVAGVFPVTAITFDLDRACVSRLLIAFVVLPVFVPLAVIVLEPTRRRKLMMVPFALTGSLTAS